MAVIIRGDEGEDAPRKSLISLGRRSAKQLAKARKSTSQVFDFIWRRLAKVGEEENPHTPYARRRRGTARRVSGFRRRIGAAP
ncbi:MAG TPA: hypothetical protein VFA57_12505 [Pseudolabrys sp.]|nr:hypothetical protein [Pseudolabrys sp.]